MENVKTQKIPEPERKEKSLSIDIKMKLKSEDKVKCPISKFSFNISNKSRDYIIDYA